MAYRVNTFRGTWWDRQTVDEWDDTDEERFFDGMNLAHKIFPAPGVGLEFHISNSFIEWNLDGPISFTSDWVLPGSDLSTRAGQLDLLDYIVEIMEDVNDRSGNFYHTVVAMLPRDTDTARGLAWVGNPGALARTERPCTLPHEIGHMLYSVLYTPDGTHWELLSNYLTETSFEWDTTASPGGTHASIQIIATDGVNSASALSESFTVATKPPQAFILSPEDGAREAFKLHGCFCGSGLRSRRR